MQVITIDIQPKPLTLNEHRVKDMLDQGRSIFQIAAKLRMGENTVREVIYSIRKKESIVAMRIAEEKKARILDLHNQGMSQLDISLEVGCAMATVYKVLKRVSDTDKTNAVITEPESTEAEIATEDTEIATELATEPAELVSPPAEVIPKEPPQAVILAVSEAINAASDKIDKNLFAICQLQHENEELRNQIESLVNWLKEVGVYEGIAD